MAGHIFFSFFPTSSIILSIPSKINLPLSLDLMVSCSSTSHLSTPKIPLLSQHQNQSKFKSGADHWTHTQNSIRIIILKELAAASHFHLFIFKPKGTHLSSYLFMKRRFESLSLDSSVSLYKEGIEKNVVVVAKEE